MKRVYYSLIEQEKRKRRADRNFVMYVAILATLLLIVTVLSSYVFFNVRVSGASMDPTLYGGSSGKNDGDVLIANMIKAPKKGDIVIIEGVESYWLIKRVIATEGDTVVIGDGKEHNGVLCQSGYVYVNGVKIPEPYLNAQGVTVWDETDQEKKFGNPIKNEYTLKKDEIFYLGDNRDRSSDCRSKGVCKESNIIGVVEDWSVKSKGFLNWLYSIPQAIRNFFGG